MSSCKFCGCGERFQLLAGCIICKPSEAVRLATPHTYLEDAKGKPYCSCGHWRYNGARDKRKAHTTHKGRFHLRKGWICFDKSPRICEHKPCGATFNPNWRTHRFHTQRCARLNTVAIQENLTHA